MGFRSTIAFWLGAAFLPLSALAAARLPADWQASVTVRPRGDFPNPRPLVATYSFGWSEVLAATAEIRFAQSNGQLQLDGTGQTVGLVRALWKFDTSQHAAVDPITLHPVSTHQVDVRRHKTVTTDLLFRRGAVERIRTDTKTKKQPTPKTFAFRGAIFDLFSALLYLRSQPLHDGDIYRIVVYPATNPYLATLTVAGHSSTTVEAGTYPAIKLDVQLSKIGKKGDLEPHRKFRRASVWVSDDADRLLLRIEASVFVGTVFAELQSVRFEKDKS